MARSETGTLVAPGHVVYSESESSDDEIQTAVSAVGDSRPTNSIEEQPCKTKLSAHAPVFVPKLNVHAPVFVPNFMQPSGDLVRPGKDSGGKVGGRGKAKASRRQSRTPSPDSRTPSSVPIGRKLSSKSATSNKAAPFKGAAAVNSDDEDATTPRVRTCAATRPANTEVNFLNELDEEANLSEAGEEEVEEMVAGDSKSRKKKASRPFKATRQRYRKFMDEQFAAIAKDPSTYDLSAVEIPRCLSKEKDSEAKVLLKLYLRAEQAKQATLEVAPQA